MLPLRALLRELELEIAAGEAGLDRAVRWVHISELSDPTPWLSGGELLLTTGLAIGDDAEAYVSRLAAHGLTGLGFGVGFGHERLPEPLLAAAAAHGFPLFAVPYELPFIAITEKAFSHLVNEQYAVLRRALAAHERLERVVLSERGLDGVAAELASLIGGPALIYDGRGELLARRGEAPVAELSAEMRERVHAGARRGFVPGALAPGALALPVARAAQPAPRGDGPPPEAWLVAAKDAGALTELDRLTLHQAVTIVALELLRRRVVDDTERRLAGDVISALVTGDLAGPELARRLEPFGLRDRVGVLVLAPSRAARGPAEEELVRAVREEAGGGLVAPTGKFLCALLPASGDEELFALAERLHARVARVAGEPLGGGAGRTVSPGELRRGFHEARCALEARELSANGVANGMVKLATYRDLGSFQLLLSLQDDDALRLFCDSILAPIEESEGAYGGELMRSLEAFIESNGQWERAAKALFCHRHTLRYRIRRVEELTGRSLDSARDRIDFWLALRGRELVHTERT
ncbi:PucR family transcriptional regulator ligand-binding domain-containing protein [Solirubrobacter ginsenosidimutans]|uniref:PucR family transcriptional regulator ligand-binding domain-containing protein n=1 Tax=Solirubrobacter ginsenosidimutans TaxID=490573 RepID=A0A9X3N470_9ACTN|nr:PucR family transcriptional regulator [Solirubrobacter ginsenosidimutans]MDA0166700.1 PucR family transcriptional regulator ligand-binding domain-containing protein [Solirubrobacter ginsenosidimutans]